MAWANCVVLQSAKNEEKSLLMIVMETEVTVISTIWRVLRKSFSHEHSTRKFDLLTEAKVEGYFKSNKTLP